MRFPGRYFFYILFFISSVQAQISDELKSKSIPVISEKSNVVSIKIDSLSAGQKMIFIRIVPEFDEFEIIAEGNVVSSSAGFTKVKLRMEKLKKIPTSSDFAVLLAEPKKFEPANLKKPNLAASIEKNDIEDQESGFINIFYQTASGRLESQSTNLANSLKQINSLKMSGFGLEWFFDFLPNFGFSFYSSSGNVPVYSYFKLEEPTSISQSEFRIQFRNQLLKPGWRWQISASAQSSKFKTTNSDAYVLSTSTNLNGLVLNTGYDFMTSMETPKKAWGRAKRLYLEIGYFSSVDVKDGSVSRGTSSSGSNQTSLAIGYMHLTNLVFIPYLNSFFIDFKISQISQPIKMSGATRSENGSFYTIPENGSYKENQTFFQITLGFRFPDNLGSGLKSRN